MENITNALVAVFANIPRLFYFLYTCLASLVDLCQFLFRQIAGLETMYVNNEPIEGDLVSHFLIGIITGKYPILQTLFWSFVILGIIFLFVTTIIAVIKSEANPWTSENKKGEKKVANGKGKIFATAGRALVRMAMVPITCIFACYFGGIVLNAIEGATTVSQTSSYLSEIKVTSASDPTITYDAFKKNKNGTYFHYDIFGISLESKQISFSGIAFKTVMHSANRVRSTDWFITDVIYAPDTKEDQTGNFGVFNQAVDQESCASLIDEVFANNAILNNDYAGKKLDIEKGEMSEICRPGADFFSDYDDNITQFSKFNVGLVWYYYDLWKFNIIVGFAYMIIMFSMFYKIIFGLVRRLIYIMVLYITLPAFCGLSPLDNEGSYGKWKGAYIKEFLTVYGTVAAMNLFLIILPYLEQISFFPSSNVIIGLINKLVGLLFTLVGLSMVKEFSGLLSGFFGGGDIAANGETAFKGAKSIAGQAVGSISKIGGGLAKAATSPTVALGKGIYERAKNKREDKFNAENEQVESLQQEVKDIESQTELNRQQERQQLEEVQRNRMDAFDDYSADVEDSIRETADNDISQIRSDAEKQINAGRQEYVDKYMAKEDPLKLNDKAYVEKRKQYYADRYDGLKGTKIRNEGIRAEMNSKIAERRAQQQKDINSANRINAKRREDFEKSLQEEINQFDQQTKREIENATRVQKQQIKEIQDKHEAQIKKQDERAKRRAKQLKTAGKVYKALPVDGLKKAVQGMREGLGVDELFKKDKNN